MRRDDILNEYFDYMYDLVCENRFPDDISYRKLLGYLFDTPFRYSIRKDNNRAEDGLDFRRRFSTDDYILDHLNGKCSVLETMIALSVRCEETIMDDPNKGDRTGQWFWHMIANLGLANQTDRAFSESYVEDIIERFLDREYEPDGKGGLFEIRDCEYDLRDVEIWVQLCWYLDRIT